jgi:hypothetical protein
MQMILDLLGSEPITLLGKYLTPASPTAQVPLRVLEYVRIYSKSTNRLNFGELDNLLDCGVIRITIPPSRYITTSAQLRALEVRGVITVDTLADPGTGTPVGYRGGLEFSSKFILAEDEDSNTVHVDVNPGSVVTYGSPVSTGQANADGVSTDVPRADHVHRTGLLVQEEGVDKGTRPTIDFKGAVTVVDNPGDDKVEVTVEAGGGLRKRAFTSGDWGAGFVDIELPVPAGSTIEEVSLVVVGAFDNAAQARVGDAADNSRLMDEYDSDLAEAGNTYKTTSNYTYVASTQLRVYFVGGPPSAGNAVVYVYFSTS